MLIDWFTVGAQIVNFLILLALLKWLLFDRIVHAMDQREGRIASRLEEGEKKMEEAEHRAKNLEEERRRFDSKRDGLLQEAKEKADAHRQELARQARDEVDRMRHEWEQELKKQQRQFLQDMSQQAGDLLKRAVHKALVELADADLQQGTIRVFLAKLENMDGPTRDRFKERLREMDGDVVVASAEGLSEDSRSDVANSLKHHFHENIQPSFETAPELISGIEIRLRGQVLGWSLSYYLDTFTETLEEKLHERMETVEPSKE